MPTEPSALSDKQVAYSTLQRMPEAATLEEMSEELAILASIRCGETAAEAGQVLTQAEVERRSASWIGT